MTDKSENHSNQDEEPIEFFYGDDFGGIEIEELGTRNGTTTRRMEITRWLAASLYDELDEELHERPEKYLVVVSANTGFAELSNTCVVEANSEQEARQKVDAMDNPQNYGRYYIERIDDLDDNWSHFR